MSSYQKRSIVDDLLARTVSIYSKHDSISFSRKNKEQSDAKKPKKRTSSQTNGFSFYSERISSLKILSKFV